MASIFNENERKVRRLRKMAEKVDALADKYGKMTDAELAGQTAVFKDRLAAGETLDDILYDAFAALREAAARVLGMRPFFVQVMGGIALHQGRIAEMGTGEGKTLVATMPSYLNALAGHGVHIVTVNDYLARRDAAWMGKVHRFMGLTVGVIVPGMTNEEKRAAYNCDITYCTNNELGFDFLRDNMVVRKEMKMQRELNFAIIDEVDSILIDEARTPLIIRARAENPASCTSPRTLLRGRCARGRISRLRRKRRRLCSPTRAWRRRRDISTSTTSRTSGTPSFTTISSAPSKRTSL